MFEKFKNLANNAKLYTQEVNTRNKIAGISAALMLMATHPSQAHEIQNPNFGVENKTVTQEASRQVLNHYLGGSQSIDYYIGGNQKQNNQINQNNNQEDAHAQNNIDHNKELDMFANAPASQLYKQLPHDFQMLIAKRTEKEGMDNINEGFRDAFTRICYGVYIEEVKPSENDYEMQKLAKKYVHNDNNEVGQDNYFDAIFSNKNDNQQNQQQNIQKISKPKMKM
jgi:hypothetical protein